MDLRKVNLNLLVHLNTLLNECSVSEAARKSYLSQTAMSNILKQLRELFKDELFVREANYLQPTAFAEQLHKKLKKVLHETDELFKDRTFNPETDEYNFKLSLSNHGEVLVLPELAGYLTTQAPRIRLETLSVINPHQLYYKLSKEVDLTVMPAFFMDEESLVRKRLFNEEAWCFMRAGHPLANKTLNTKLYQQSEHAGVKFLAEDISFIDKVLLEQNIVRNVKVYVSTMFALLQVVQDTDLIATMPRFLAIEMSKHYNIVGQPVPFKINRQPIEIAYHRRLENFPPLVWLVKFIQSLFVDWPKE